MSVKQGIWRFVKKYDGRKGQDKNPRIKYLFDIKKCKVCPFREGMLYKKVQKVRSYSVTIKSTEHKDQEAFQEYGRI